ncbi:nucleotidyltransferase domain-containing protein [archaeon]|nr:nucleotidyltransferase domain-containing protein [archaeon]
MRKEENVLELFFNEPSKHWHFEEILRKANISRPQVNNWLKKLIKEEIVRRVKEKGKMPYYVGFFENPNFQSRKRLFALERMQKTGFLSHLISLEKAKTIIVFGSFTRGDWYSDSDIDLFIYGNAENFDRGEYQLKLGREIQVFNPKTKEDLKKFESGFMRNILRGITVKGLFNFLEVSINA